jgi:hypothetical protein
LFYVADNEDNHEKYKNHNYYCSVCDKAISGIKQFKSSLFKNEFKTLKSAVGYTSTIHRLWHIQEMPYRNRNSGIRSKCNFCQELVYIANKHFQAS